MSRRIVKARSAKSARNKACSKNRVVTKVNYMKGSKSGNMKSYQVLTRARKK